jgi:excisionase family DNA binding protein
MTNQQPGYLTVPEVAASLQMTPDGVYKLIQRGKLEGTRLSERKMRVTRAALDRFNADLQRRADEHLAGFTTGTVESLTEAFVTETGLDPVAWLGAWKRDELDDTPENMGLLVRAAGIRAMVADGQPTKVGVSGGNRTRAPAAGRP